MPSALMAVGGVLLLSPRMPLGLDVTLFGNISSGWDAFQFGVPTLLPHGCMTEFSGVDVFDLCHDECGKSVELCRVGKNEKNHLPTFPRSRIDGTRVEYYDLRVVYGDMPVTSVIVRCRRSMSA